MKKGYVKVDSAQPSRGTFSYDTKYAAVSAASQEVHGTTFRIYLENRK